MIICPSCGARISKGSGYCSRCGVSLRGVARHLGSLPAVFGAGFIAASTALIQIVLLRAFDTVGRLSPTLLEPAEVMSRFVSGGDLLFAGVAGAICGAAFKDRRIWERAGWAALAGSWMVISWLVARVADGGALTIIYAAGAPALAGICGAFGPAVVSLASRFAPFSWALRLNRENPSHWCFAVVVLGMQVFVLAAPWLVVWVLVGSVALKVAGGLVRRRGQGSPAVAERVMS